ncbi:hypothetical protein ABZ871_15670 [Streptomyces populi]
MAALGAVTVRAAQPDHTAARTAGTHAVAALSADGPSNKKTDADIPLCC